MRIRPSKQKGKKIMKKMMMTLVALMTILMAFAANENAKNTNVTAAYDMRVNYRTASADGRGASQPGPPWRKTSGGLVDGSTAVAADSTRQISRA